MKKVLGSCPHTTNVTSPTPLCRSRDLFAYCWPFDKGRFLTTPSSRPLRQESPSPLSVGRVGPVTFGGSVAGESPRTCPPQDHHVGRLCLLQPPRQLLYWELGVSHRPVLMKISPTGKGDHRVTRLLSGLACTVYPMTDALYATSS